MVMKGCNYVHTLSYNLPSETEKAVKLLYDQNDNFKHYLVDLSFPLETDEIPNNIEDSIKRNTERLKEMCVKYGSTYVKIPNVGVSQNWDSVYKHLNMRDNDVLIGADPDERPQDDNWIEAMSTVLRSGFGLVSLMVLDHLEILKNKSVTDCSGVRVMKSPGLINWALIGMSGKFLKGMKGVPYREGAERYGWIEHETMPYFDKLNMPLAILPDYKVRHTAFNLGDDGSSRLLHEWKQLIIHQINKYGQISFEEFLNRKLKGEL